MVRDHMLNGEAHAESVARPPEAEQQAEISAVDQAVAVEVRVRILGPPGREHQSDVRAVDHATSIEVAGAAAMGGITLRNDPEQIPRTGHHDELAIRAHADSSDSSDERV